jgi:hypothetical protein
MKQLHGSSSEKGSYWTRVVRITGLPVLLGLSPDSGTIFAVPDDLPHFERTVIMFCLQTLTVLETALDVRLLLLHLVNVRGKGRANGNNKSQQG